MVFLMAMAFVVEAADRAGVVDGWVVAGPAGGCTRSATDYVVAGFDKR